MPPREQVKPASLGVSTAHGGQDSVASPAALEDEVGRASSTLIRSRRMPMDRTRLSTRSCSYRSRSLAP